MEWCILETIDLMEEYLSLTIQLNLLQPQEYPWVFWYLKVSFTLDPHLELGIGTIWPPLECKWHSPVDCESIPSNLTSSLLVGAFLNSLLLSHSARGGECQKGNKEQKEEERATKETREESCVSR